MKKVWTIWIVMAAMAGMTAACGEEDYRLTPVEDSGGSDAGNAQPDTGENTDAGIQQNTGIGADAGTPAREDGASAPADAATQPDSQSSDTGQPGQDAGSNQPDSGTTAGTDSGTGSDTDTGTETGTDAGTPALPANTDVVKVTGACQMKFSALYAGGAASGELRGSVPGVMTWDAGPAVDDTDSDGYLEYSPASLPVGTFDLSYLGGGNWALYGAEAQLRPMSPEARAFVSCNWFDGTNIVAVANPECHLRIKVETGCLVSGDGNMANLQ